MTSARGAFGSEFKVGQVLYFISSKTEQVIPALVSEKITRSSLGSQIKVTYVLKIKQGRSFKEVEVDPLKVDLFGDPEDIRSFMMERTAKAINKLVETAVAAAALLKPVGETTPDSPVETAVLDDIVSDEPAEVILPDGTVAKLRM